MPCRLLIVDDSAVVRQVLTRELGVVPGIEVVGSAADAYAARNKIVELEPDVITLDLEMPRMDGLTFLAKLMRHHPLPVIVVSSLTTAGSDHALQALREGAVDVIGKPGDGRTVADLVRELSEKVLVAAAARVSAHAHPDTTSFRRHATDGAPAGRRLVALAASTGGTVALEHILRVLPEDAPGIMVVQHMPAGFTASFARRLDALCAVAVREAEGGMPLTDGTVLIAPGGRHLELGRQGDRAYALVGDGPEVNRQRPSADVLFASFARRAGADAVGAILTGMGIDGAAGLLKMREAGAATLAQDEASSVVYGMPRAAVELGAVERVLPLAEMAQAIMQCARA